MNWNGWKRMGPGITNSCLKKCTYAYFGALTYVVCKYMFFGKHKAHLRSTYVKNKFRFLSFSFFNCPMSVANTNAPRLFQPIRTKAKPRSPTELLKFLVVSFRLLLSGFFAAGWREDMFNVLNFKRLSQKKKNK